jgi:hypothetical protein
MKLSKGLEKNIGKAGREYALAKAKQEEANATRPVDAKGRVKVSVPTIKLKHKVVIPFPQLRRCGGRK